ncbi:MAG: Asp-tRNA(Asn)/Glu-tRNA(Gln) amidotransferase subunit GatA [Candidatus Babeliales bacterium]
MKPFLTVKELVKKIKNKEVSQKEVVNYYCKRLKRFNTKLNCALEVFQEELLLDKGCPLSNNNSNNNFKPLSGIPYLVKDIICQKNHITSAASKILSNFKSPYNATVIERLNKAGAISIGRANCDEFAMGASGETSAYGPTKNPWNLELVPGGSSSGSAAAVTAGLVPFALGSETGGSIRNPAAFCGLVATYPTYGLHSRFGVIALASSFDQVCPLTKTVFDNALVYSALSGQDKYDSTTVPIEPRDYTIGLDGKLPKNLTIGIIKDALSEKIDPQVAKAFDQACEQLKKLGAKLKIIDLPSLKYGNSVYFIINRAEAASNLAKYDGSLYGVRNKGAKNLHDMYVQTRQEGFGKEVKLRILVGNYVLSASHKDAFYNKAQKVRAMIKAEFDTALKEVDVLTSPTMPILPFKLGQFAGDPVAMYLADLFLISNNVIGYPAISLPCGYSKENLPIGIQFIGPRLSESLLFKTAYAFEQSTEYYSKNPEGYE